MYCVTDTAVEDSTYRKVPKFSYTRKLCCNLPKIQTKRPNLWVFRQTDANGIANSEDPDQTAPLCAQTCLSENLGSLQYLYSGHIGTAIVTPTPQHTSVFKV